MQSELEGSLTALWLRKWGIHPGTENPTFYARIPANLGYLRSYITEDAYMPTRGEAEGTKTYKRRQYYALRKLSEADAPLQDMRIVKIWPTTDWEAVWQNLVTAPSAESEIVNWYKVIHDIIPTNEQLNRLKIAPKDRCNECGRKDTLCHRLIECREGQETWTRTKTIIARKLRASPV